MPQRVLDAIIDMMQFLDFRGNMRQIFIFFFVSSLPSSLTGVTEIGTAHVKMLSSMTASVEVIEQLFLILSTVGPRLYNSAFNSAHPLS